MQSDTFTKTLRPTLSIKPNHDRKIIMSNQINSEIRPGTFVGSSARCVEQNQASYQNLSTEVSRWERTRGPSDGETYFSGTLNSGSMHAGAYTDANGQFRHGTLSCHRVTDVDLSDPHKLVIMTTDGEIVINIFEAQS